MKKDSRTEEEEIDEQFSKGFDRGLKFSEIKEELIDHLTKHYKNLHKPHTAFKKKKLINKLCYVLIALIQLRNGSRISEAVEAFLKYCDSDSTDEQVFVKIAKSRKNTKDIQTKARYRKMVFPTSWIDMDIWDYVLTTKTLTKLIQNKRIEKRVLDYLLKFCNSNTHSLRYAYINHLLMDLKVPMNTVSKLVGHLRLDQLLSYTSNRAIDETLGMDI